MSQDLRLLVVRSLVFALPLGLLLGGLEYDLARIPNLYTTKLRLAKAKLPTAEVLVSGSSEAENDIDPKQFSRPGFNLGMVSQTLYQDMWLLRWASEHAPHARLAIVVMSYFSLWVTMDSALEKWRQFDYYRFFGIPFESRLAYFDPRAYSLFALYGPVRVRNHFIGGAPDTSGDQSDFGFSISPSQLSADPQVRDAQAVHWIGVHEHQMREQSAPYNIHLLEATLPVLAQRGVRVAFVIPPVAVEYYRHANKARYAQTEQVIKELCARFPGTLFFSYLQDARFSNEDFSNVNHLGLQGAERLSGILNDEVVNPVLNGAASRSPRLASGQ